jgi:SAM-dependent methyltransferase
MAAAAGASNLLRDVFDQRFEMRDGRFFFDGQEVRCTNGILRFTPDASYATGNFSKLREQHATLQLDSVNGTRDRLNTILERTRWPAEFFRGKLILECGCGAGADTEVLLQLGARVVAVDLAGLDVCRANLGDNPNLLLIQASIDDMPFRRGAFDVVWCHRVLQHTPDPAAALAHILTFVKEEGYVFVHSYARSLSQMLSWKYALRPITRRMQPEHLYNWVAAWVPPLYALTTFLRRIPPDVLGRTLFRVANQVVPIRNYRFMPAFADKDDAYLIEYAVHDTFDALSPRYDSPLSPAKFRTIASPRLKRKFEIEASRWITLLRTVSQ